MTLLTIFRFELSYQLRQVTTWLYLAVLLMFTFVLKGVVTPGDGVYTNNTFHITATTVVGVLIWLIMAASVAGEAAARDLVTGMFPLTYASPITRLQYLGGRFLAAVTLNALLVLSLPIGVMLAFYMPGMDPGGLGPFNILPFLNVYFLIALPLAFVATALQFGLAVLTRQPMTSYLASLLLALVAQIVALSVAAFFGNWDLVRLLDPVGISGIVGNELQTWTPAEKNTRLVMLEGMFLWNRLLWLGLAVGVLVFTFRRFSFAHGRKRSFPQLKWRRSRPEVPADESAPERTAAISVPQVRRDFGVSTGVRQTLAIAGASFRTIAGSPVGIPPVAAIAGVCAAFGDRIMTQFGVPLLPTTSSVVAFLTPSIGNLNTPWVVITLLMIYFSGELIWKEREAGQNDLVDAAPVSEWALLLGKYLGLALIILAWIALLMAGGILMQLGLGYHKLEIGVYVRALFGLQLIDYLLFAMLALSVQAIVNQKYTGYLVMLIVTGFIAFPSVFGVEHSMLIFGKDPGWRYTDMRGFGSAIRPWLWFKAYWAAWAVFFAVIARVLWVRGREQRLHDRMLFVRRRLSRLTIRVAMLAGGLIVTLGSFLFYNTNVLNEYHAGDDIKELNARYERTYGRYRDTPQPQLTGTNLEVDIDPGRQRVGIRATYTLLNRGKVAIDSIHLASVSGVEPIDVRFNRAAAAVLTDRKLGHYIYVLKQPIRPGDSVRIDFEVHLEEPGFRHNGTNEVVVKNGTYFTNYDMLPNIGYQRYRELSDPVLRNRYHLPKRPEVPSLYDSVARNKPISSDQNTFEAVISTAIDETAVAPGNLIRTWAAGNRRYFHFRTDAPIRGEYSILSGRYAVRKGMWKDVAIRIYHHPEHVQNTDRILRSVIAAMDYYSGQFGPYPYKHITVVEKPGRGDGASSEASMIDFGEQFAVFNPDDSPDGFDLPFYIVAHEVAHQWFGGASLTPANVEGAGVLVEGLAVYSGMQVLENHYGDAHLRRYVRYLHSFYEMPRSLATPSLLHANEKFLYYRKAGLAMYALSRYIGKERVNGALRRLLERHHSGEVPLPTTLDLYREIRQVTPDSLRYFLEDLFKKNTYWRLKTRKIAAARTKTGEYEITLKVQAQKVVIDSGGKEHEEAMNDWLEIGLYGNVSGVEKPLYLNRHRIRTGEQILKVTVPKKPVRGGIDPNFLMIDLRIDDNVMELNGE